MSILKLGKTMIMTSYGAKRSVKRGVKFMNIYRVTEQDLQELEEVKVMPQESIEKHLELLELEKLEVMYKKISTALNSKHNMEAVSTKFEKRFGAYLKSLARVKFFPGFWIGRNCVDIFFQRYGLIVEIDGGIHNSEMKMNKDEFRDDYFKKLKLMVKHVENENVWNFVLLFVDAVRTKKIKQVDTRSKNKTLKTIYIKTIARNIKLL